MLENPGGGHVHLAHPVDPDMIEGNAYDPTANPLRIREGWVGTVQTIGKTHIMICHPAHKWCA